MEFKLTLCFFSYRYLTLNATFRETDLVVTERIVSFQSVTYIQALNGGPPYDDGRYQCTLTSNEPIQEGVEYHPLTDFANCSLVCDPLKTAVNRYYLHKNNY